jgi:tetratricopeptide (TPR) repeat protein
MPEPSKKPSPSASSPSAPSSSAPSPSASSSSAPSSSSPRPEVIEPPEHGPPGDARFDLDVTGRSAAEALGRLKENVEYWVARGRYNKVRIKRGGKPVLPDIPVGALVAVEAATFFWTGLLRAALVNVVGRALFEVELVNEAEGAYRKGLEHFLAGDVDDADVHLTRALEIDERYARAHLQMGVLRKMQGRKPDAIRHFQRVVELDRFSDAGREARAHLEKLAT